MPIGYDITKNELLHSKIIPREQTIQAILFILIIGTNIGASLERYYFWAMSIYNLIFGDVKKVSADWFPEDSANDKWGSQNNEGT